MKRRFEASTALRFAVQAIQSKAQMMLPAAAAAAAAATVAAASSAVVVKEEPKSEGGLLTETEDDVDVGATVASSSGTMAQATKVNVIMQGYVPLKLSYEDVPISSGRVANPFSWYVCVCLYVARTICVCVCAVWAKLQALVILTFMHRLSTDD